MIDEAALADNTKVVERENTLRGHAVVDAERNLGRDPPDRPGGRDGEKLIQHRDTIVTGQNEIGPSLFAGCLVPPDLAARYHDNPAARSSSSSR